MPTRALLMPVITRQMSPPLKVSGVWVSRVHISASLLFQPDRAFSRSPTIQLSLIEHRLPQAGYASHGETHIRLFSRPYHTTPMAVRISLAKAMISPPNTQRIP